MQQKIGRYEIKDELGRGGMATVYRAYDPSFSRHVAIKVLPPHFLHDPTFKDRFLTEARTIAALEHPAIVPVYDFGASVAAGGSPFIVMRLLEGGSLRDRLDEYGALPLAEAARILRRLAPALDFAHRRGIIHRDLKPGNIMFDSEGEPYLADFGIARMAEATQTMTIVGTPAFMSPEQWEGNRKLDGRSDLYALGVIFFEMVTGSRPFVSDTPAGLMRAHLMEPVPDVYRLKQDLPLKCQPVIEKALAKNRDDRYQTAESLASAVEILATGAELPPHLTLALDPEPQPTANLALSQSQPLSSSAYKGVTIAPETETADPPVDSGTRPAKRRRRWWPWVLGLLGLFALGTCGFLVVVGGLLGAADLATPTPLPQPTNTLVQNTELGGEELVPLGFDTAYAGWLPPDSSVLFEVPVAWDRPVVLVVSSPSSTDLILTLYDEAGEVLEEIDYVFGDDAEIVPLFPEVDTVYKAELAGLDGHAGEYLIGYGELTFDAYNVALAETNHLAAEDVVEYNVDIHADEALLVFTFPEGDILDIALYVDDEFGNEFIYTDTGFSGEWEAVLLYPARAMNFYVGLESFDPGGSYQIFIIRLPVTELNQ